MAKKVLIVDDEPELLNLMKYTLEGGGYEISTCDTGRQVLAALQKNKPDVMLPGIDGHSLVNKISQDENLRNIPIIVLSALEATKALFQKFQQVVAFMPKPFKSEEFLNTVKSVLK